MPIVVNKEKDAYGQSSNLENMNASQSLMEKNDTMENLHVADEEETTKQKNIDALLQIPMGQIEVDGEEIEWSEYH